MIASIFIRTLFYLNLKPFEIYMNKKLKYLYKVRYFSFWFKYPATF
jgi:hypothetical protein